MKTATRGFRALRSAARAVVETLEPRQLLAAGDPDLTFGGGDGFAVAAFSGLPNSNHDVPYSMAVQSDGRIVVAGYSGSGGNTDNRVAIARFNPDGSLDSSFDGDGLVTFTLVSTDVQAVAIAPDGKILVGGQTSAGTVQTTDWFLMRFNADGSVDNTFGGGDGWISRDFGQNFGEEITGIAVQNDRKIVITSTIFQATSQLATARYEEDGDLDPTFSGDGYDIVDFFGGVDASSNVIIDPDGKIVVVGGSVPSGSYRRFVLLRYNANGTLDNTFDGDGKAFTDFGVSAFGKDVLRDPVGNYLVGGLVGGVADAMNYAVARYTSSGALDTSFGTNAALPGTTILSGIAGHVFLNYGIALQSDGKIVFGGDSENPDPNSFESYFGLVRLTATGAPDPTFGSGGARNYDPPGYTPGFGNGRDVAIASDGKILLPGEAWANNNTDFGVFKLITEGSLPPPPVFLNGTVLTVTGTAGNDLLTLSADNTTFTAVLNGQTFTFPAASVTSINVDLGDGNDSETHLTGVPGGTANLGAGADSLRVGTGNKISPALNVIGGVGDDSVTLDVAFFTPTVFDGGGGNDTFTYNASQGNDSMLITATQVSSSGYTGTYSNVERVNTFSNFGFDTVTLQSTNQVVTYVLDAGDGNDTFIIYNAANPDGFTAPVTLLGGPGTDEIRYDDSPNPYNDPYTITPTTFTRTFVTTFNYQTTETLRIFGAGDSNSFNVTPSATTSIFIDGNNPTTTPGDSINVNLAGATGTAFTLLGAYSGRYTFTNRMPVEFQEVETDNTPFGPTVKSGAFNYQTSQTIAIQFSEDTQDLDISDLIVRNLTTNTTIASSRFFLDSTHGPGIATLAEWKVYSSSRLPDGKYEARLPAGSVRDVTGNLLATEFVMNFYVLTGDLNGDHTVSIADFITLASNFGKTNAAWADGDINYDQQVSIADFIDTAAHFGQSLAGDADPIPMAAESTTLFEKTRHRAKAKHHHRRTRLPRLARASTLFIRSV